MDGYPRLVAWFSCFLGVVLILLYKGASSIGTQSSPTGEPTVTPKETLDPTARDQKSLIAISIFTKISDSINHDAKDDNVYGLGT